VFNRDALELIVEPIERLTKLTTKLSKTLFAIEEDMVEGMESEYVEGVLSKISRFFNTKHHKITTVYTPDQTVSHTQP
jgi:hypothetical protein